jgi:hypothetical protein
MSSSSEIQGTPAQIMLFFVNAGSPPPPSAHPLGGAAGTIIRAVLLQQLPTAAGEALNQLLSTPLDQTFDQAWSQMQSTAQSMVQQAVLGAAPNAYNISVASPSQGTLSASVGNLSPGMLDTLPPGTIGMQLTLTYSLPGFGVSFSETTSGIFGSWADPSYNLTFDGVIEISIGVPNDSFIPLGAKAEFLTTNMQASAGNFFAVVIGVEDIISEWFNNQPVGGSGSSLQDQIIGINIPQLQQLFSELSSGFATAATFGFVQLGVQINTNPPPQTPPGNTVEFDLTHPFDPGPVVTNALSPLLPSLFPPQIGTSAPEVDAGGQLGVTGNFFPAAQSSQLEITWTDTTSGSVTQSEVQWGPVPNGQAPPPQPIDKLIPRHGSFDNANNFTTPKGLTPNASYAFRVRDYDVSSLIATDWSSWLVLTTQPTDQVQLVLSFNNTVIGFGTLQTDGTFSTTVIVPPSVPAGNYLLTAVLSGQTMAQTPITVVAENQPLAPVLQIVDPNTGIAYTSAAIVVGTLPVTTRGMNFSPGPVDFFVDTISGKSLGAATADQNGAFTVTLTWPTAVTGPHNILAQQGILQATAAVFGENVPQ